MPRELEITFRKRKVLIIGVILLMREFVKALEGNKRTEIGQEKPLIELIQRNRKLGNEFARGVRDMVL